MEKFSQKFRRIASLLMSLLFLVLTSCTKNSNDNGYDREQPQAIISELNEEGFDISDIISALSKAGIDFIKVYDKNEKIDLLCEEYKEVRKEDDMSCQTTLANIGEELLKSSICSVLGLNPDTSSISISEVEPPTGFEGASKFLVAITYKVLADKVVPGVGTEKVEKKYTRGFELRGKARNMAINILECKNKKCKSLDRIDDIYCAFERFVISKPQINENLLTSDYFDMEYDKEINEQVSAGLTA